jgi:hypothetical protein
MTDALNNNYFHNRKSAIYKKALQIENAHTLRNNRDLYHMTINDMTNEIRELKFDVKEMRKRNQK